MDASGRLDSQLAWRTAVEHTHQSQASPRFSVGAGRMTRRAHLSGSASHSPGNTHINLGASGGLALHRHGLTLSLRSRCRTVQLDESQRCTLELALDTPVSNDAFFEQGTAICRR